MAFLTINGENKLAQTQGNSNGLTIANFVFANIPDLGSEPVDRIADIPHSSSIVATLPYTKRGYINPNQVVYSLVMGANIGNFDFNWIGLVDVEGTLIAVSHVPTIQKRKTQNGILGNTYTRNFILKYTGIQSITATTVPSETWQIDFNARLSGIDERERLSNLDIYGQAGFLSDGWEVRGSAGTYSIAAGIGYIGGVRVKNSTAQQISTSTFPNEIWLNVSQQGDISDMSSVCEFIIDIGPFSNYVDQNGVKHYLTKIADIDSNGYVKSSRYIVENVEQHEAKKDPHNVISDLWTELAAKICPIGVPLPWPTDVAPDGWAVMKGQSFDPEIYPALALVYPSGTIPDMRGLTTVGKKDSDEILSYEADSVKTHSHPGSYVANTDIGSRSTSTNGNHNHGTPGYMITGGGSGVAVFASGFRGDNSSGTHYAGNHAHSVSIGAHGHGLYIAPEGSSENTIKNRKFNWIVRLA